MAVVQSGTPATPAQTTSGTGTVVVTGTWGTGQNRAAGNLLVATVTAWGSTSAAATAQNTGTTGWTKIYEAVGTSAVAAIWTKPATGADAAPAFTSSISGTSANTQLSCTLIELTDNVNAGRRPVVDVASTGTVVGTTGTLTVTTVGNVAAAGEYAIAVECAGGITSAANTWGTSGSFTNSFTDAATAFGHWVVGVQASPASGAALAYAPTHTITSTRTAGEVAVFTTGPPPGAVAVDAVGPAGGAGIAGATSPLTWPHINSGNAIVVPVTTFNTANTVTAVTYGGVSLALIGTRNSNNNQAEGSVALYGVISGTLPTGSNTVSVSFSGAVNHNAGSISFTAAGSFGAAFGSTATGTTAITVSVTGTATGGMIAVTSCHGAAGTWSGTNGVAIQFSKNTSSGSGADNMAAGTVASAGGSQTVGISNSSSDDSGLVAVEIRPAAGAAAPPRLNAGRTPLTAAAANASGAAYT